MALSLSVIDTRRMWQAEWDKWDSEEPKLFRLARGAVGSMTGGPRDRGDCLQAIFCKKG